MAQLKESSVTGDLQVSGGMAVANRIKANQFIELSDADAELLNNNDVDIAIGKDAASGVAALNANKDLTWNSEDVASVTRVNDTTFTIGTTDVTGYYEKGRMIRFNSALAIPVQSSTYGNSVTTVMVKSGYTIPTEITSLERSKIQNDMIFSKELFSVRFAPSSTVNDLGDATGSKTIDWFKETFQKINVTGDLTISFINMNELEEKTLIVTKTGDYTITWPTCIANTALMSNGIVTSSSYQIWLTFFKYNSVLYCSNLEGYLI